MKNLRSLFTALLLLCCGIATAEDFEVGGIYYNIIDVTNKTVEVTYRGDYDNSYNNEYTGDVVIPESVTCNNVTYSVTSIGWSAFYKCSGLTSVTIGNSVTSIGNNAFENCYGLTSITIPNSVTSIGYSAFRGCSGLTSIIVESGNSKYDSRENCNAIIETESNTLIAGCKNTIIPNSVTSIGDYAFVNCSGLTSITIPNSVTSIGYEVFHGCSGLESITIPNGVTSIGSNAFSGTAWYNNQPDGLLYLNGWLLGYKGDKPTGSIVIADGTKGIGGGAFNGCSGLTSITIPNSVTSIGYDAFRYCTGLTSITIPNSVTSIGDYAFVNCSGLTSITIPNSVTSIGYWAFEGCKKLKKVINYSSLTFTKGSTDYGYVAYYADKVINAPNGVVNGDYIFSTVDGKHSLAGYLGSEENITLPSNYNGANYAIGANVFKDNTTITSITIPNSVTSIGNYAFNGCSGLTSVTIPNSVTSIGWGAFQDCI